MNSPSRLKFLDKAGPVRMALGWFARLARRILRKPPEAEPAAKRVLFLDDDPRRAEIFLGDHPQAVWVETVVDCVQRLGENWDEVHLDHDLGGRQHVGVDDVDCGMEVIRWMCREPCDHLRATQFFVHTHNMVAGLLMVLQMRSQRLQGGVSAVRPGPGAGSWRITSPKTRAPRKTAVPTRGGSGGSHGPASCDGRQAERTAPGPR